MASAAQRATGGDGTGRADRRPILLGVAHGSRQHAAQETVAAIGRQVAALAPDLDVRVAFIQHGSPSLAEALAGAEADRAADGIMLVPLLLSAGYHLASDIAGAAAAAGARTAGPLGPDPLLTDALADRLAAVGTPPGAPVVLAAAGTSDPEAAAAVRRQAMLLSARLDVPVRAAFAAAQQPSVGAAVAEFRRAAGAPVAIAAYLLCPGLFHDQLAASGASWVSAPLGGHPAVASLLLRRYHDAIGQAAPGSASGEPPLDKDRAALLRAPRTHGTGMRG